MKITLPPFDPDGSCDKCGASDAMVFYRHQDIFYDLPERMERTCRRCRFEWSEAPLDTDAATEENP